MYPTPSLETFCCEKIRPCYGEERRNISMARSSLGPFPDEWILSGLDRILYFCGIRNACELVQKFPLNSECYYSSSSECETDESCKCYLVGRCMNRSCKGSLSALCVSSCETIGNPRNALSVTSIDHISSEVLGKSSNTLKRSTSLLKTLSKVAMGGKSRSKDGAIPSQTGFLKPPSTTSRTGFLRPPSRASLIEIPALKEASNSGLRTILSSSLPTEITDSLRKKSSLKTNEKSNKRLDGRKQVLLSPCCEKKLPKIVGSTWAMARINIFSDCSRTYEILEIKGRLPRGVIPCKTAVFFAVLPDGSSICFDYVKPGE